MRERRVTFALEEMLFIAEACTYADRDPDIESIYCTSSYGVSADEALADYRRADPRLVWSSVEDYYEAEDGKVIEAAALAALAALSAEES